MGKERTRSFSNVWKLTALLALLVLLVYLAVQRTAATQQTQALWLYGQPGFTTNASNNGQRVPGAETLNLPGATVVDTNGGLYVADTNSHRVLYYTPNSSTAVRVYGQPNFVTVEPNFGELNASSLLTPTALALDGSNNLYIADTGNNRVLFYPAGQVTATRVYGQPDFKSGLPNNGTLSATSLNAPGGLAALGTNNELYIADTGNNRVLFYESGSITPTRIYGQANFSSALANRGGAVSSTTISEPVGVAVDSGGRLYVADRGNHRVLLFPPTVVTATDVYGQPSIFSNTPNNGGVSANSLRRPTGLALEFDQQGNSRLYVADSGNNRVLYYATGQTTASRVYGQILFSSNPDNPGGPSATTLFTPTSVTFNNSSGSAGLYIADLGNNRVLYYAGTSDTTADRVYGQPTFNQIEPNNSLGSTSLAAPVRVAVFDRGTDESNGVYVADRDNHRVLYYSPGFTIASRVYGQPNFGINGKPNGPLEQPSATTLNRPGGLALGSNGSLYVADRNNHRVLVFPSGSPTATLVYGQPNFTSIVPNAGGVSASSLDEPTSVAIDSTGGVYIADRNNHRVLFYPSGQITATRVYGQPGFNSSGAQAGGLNANSLWNPIAVALDSQNNLYVVDQSNYRVLFYPSGQVTATRVYGQPNFTSRVPNNGGITASSLGDPNDVTVNERGVYITDVANNRVLFYAGDSVMATQVYGQPNFNTATANTGGLSEFSLFTPTGLALDDVGNLFVTDLGNNRVTYYPGCSFTVTETEDDGSGGTCGTLSYGVKQARLSLLPLNIPISPTLTTITVTGQLPTVRNDYGKTVNIQGSCQSQPNGIGKASPVLVAAQPITPSVFTTPNVGITLTNNTYLLGVGFAGFGSYGIDIKGDNNRVECSWLGTADGVTAVPNGVGIRINGTNNTLGQEGLAGRGLLISGNGGAGILIASGINNKLYNSFIGYRQDKTTALPNRNGIVARGGQLKITPGSYVRN